MREVIRLDDNSPVVGGRHLAYRRPMRTRSRFPTYLSLFSVVTLGALTMPACGDKPQGAVMLAMQTDMKVDTDIAAVGVYVTVPSSGRVIFSSVVKAVIDPKTKQNTVHLPATLALYTQSGNAAPIRIRMVGFRYTTPGDTSSAVPTVINEALTTVPTTSIVRLPMSLSFVNRNTAQGPAIAFSATGVVTLQSAQLGLAALPKGEEYSLLDQTCPGAQILGEDGECTDVPEYAPADLPLHTDTDVFGGGAADGKGATCFDTVGCLRGGRRLVWEPIPGQDNGPDASELSFRLKGDPIDFSTVAVVAVMKASSGAGECPDEADADGIKKCFVVLDSEGTDASGKFPKLAKFPYRFDEATGTLKFKRRFFTKVKTDKDFLGLYVTNPACGIKTRGVPTCDAFPQAQKHQDGTDGPPPYLVADATVDSSTDADVDSSVDASVGPDAGVDAAFDAMPDAAPDAAADPNAQYALSAPEPRPTGLAIFPPTSQVYFARNGSGLGAGFATSVVHSPFSGQPMSSPVGGALQPPFLNGYRISVIGDGKFSGWLNGMVLTDESTAAAYLFGNDADNTLNAQFTLPADFFPIGAAAAALEGKLLVLGHNALKNATKAAYCASVSTCNPRNITFSDNPAGVYPTAMVQQDANHILIGTNLGTVYSCNLPSGLEIACVPVASAPTLVPIVDIAYNSAAGKIAVLAVSSNGDQVGDGVYLIVTSQNPVPLALRGANNPDLFFEGTGSLRNTVAIANNGVVLFSTRAGGGKPSRVWSVAQPPTAMVFEDNHRRVLDVRTFDTRVYYTDWGTGNLSDGALYGRAIP